jgi:four helix bundle protein
VTTAIRSYHDLIAWQKAVALSLEIYRLTATFPADERFGLISQLRRASVGVPSNIAEGYGRGTTADYVRFCRMARGSLYELETQILIACQLGYVSDEARESVTDQVSECSRVLGGLIRSIDHADHSD